MKHETYIKSVRHQNIDRDMKMCFGKSRYPSFNRAEQYAQKGMDRAKADGKPVALRAYFCPICSGFHITKKPAEPVDEQ